MGVESKLIIEEPFYNSNAKNPKDMMHAIPLARMEMHKMGPAFDKIFKTNITWTLYGDNDEDLTITPYGDTCKYTDIDNVISYLEKEIAAGNDYRMLRPCLELLKALKNETWSNPLIVVQYCD